MGILSGEEIKKEIERGNIDINPLKDEQIKPASVDLTLGGEVFLASEDNKAYLDKGDVLTLPAGEMALVLTRERLNLSKEVVGSIGLRSYFSRKGIDLLAGPQVDPGFKGPLHVVLLNLSPSPQIIQYGEEFLTLEFRQLAEPVEKPYRGKYYDLDSITSEEIRDIKKGKGIALSEAVEAMRNIARDVSSLEKNVKQLTKKTDLWIGIFVSSFVALAIALIVKLAIG
ncbi:MAG: dCTP deaminase [Candidatus Korarchaeota archaeon]|nr:dCTP deaminase [Candidatus Korarchaeota archaeon]NIU85709.1 dCTP deaminase [Candidatus Thorarchaeota archaeon]NIW14935.1 dCTP deaminase [Candidatus Thorarchaeota archaeon]NIW52975.1 dCTP deaminase [Candidatus Korarchaeota archaeon]